MEIRIPTNESVYRVPEGTELTLIVPSQADLVILEKDHSATKIELVIEEGAHVVYVVNMFRNNGDYTRTAQVGKGATLKWIDIQTGEGLTERVVETMIILSGEAARVELLGIFAGQGSDNMRFSHKTKHAAPHSVSRMESRGILTGASFAHQTSSIVILPNQNGCSGDERAETLLLSENARVVAVPELEIGNNDVQCKHAVTTTRLNAEKLFYLAARGLDEKTSRSLLIEAHLAPILEQVPESVREKVNIDITQYE